MKVLLVEYRDGRNPRAGGAERALHEVFGRLVQRGWSVDYLCSAFDGDGEDEIDGVRILRRGPEPLFGLSAARALHGELRGTAYDLVIEGIDKLPFFLPWLAPRRRVACIIPHLLGETAAAAAGRLAGAAINAAETLMPLCYRRCTLITGAESTRRELERRGFAPERIEVVPYGLDHALHVPREPSLSTEPPFILYVGRLRRYKSLDVALRAFARIVAEVPGVRFKIAGEGDDRSRLEQLARELGIGDRVDFVGFVSEAEKISLMQRARVLAYASRKEGWGLPVIEANACGTPAVASRVDGLRDAVRDGESGVLVPYGDAAAFGEALLRVLRDDAWHARLRAGALAWAGRFHWEASADAMERALTGALRD